LNRLLRRASARFYLRHPWQLVLSIAGVSLGVAVYVGVQLANDGAARAFDSSAALLRGSATHRLLPLGGDLDETVYRELVTTRGVDAAAPIVEAEVSFDDRPGVRARLLGVDPLQEIGVRRYSAYAVGSSGQSTRLMTEPGTALLPQGLATELGVQVGDRTAVHVDGRPAEIEMIGVIPAEGADAGADPPIVTDIATAQELRGRTGVISYIDLRLSPEDADALAARPPPRTILTPADNGMSSFAELAKAFRTNLTALGLLALVVGTFLIYATMSFAVVQRRATLGVLRAIGVSRRELLASVLLEALVIGAIATALGLVGGYVLARFLIDLVLGTIGDLYFRAAVKAAAPALSIFGYGAALGLGATLLAALRPALDAARGPTAAVLQRAELERRSRRQAQLASIVAVPLAMAGAALIALGPKTLYPAFAGMFAILGAGALAMPLFAMGLMRTIEALGRQRLSLASRLAIRGVTASLSRTGVAMAALAVAVATVNGVGLMIGSFRSSLVDWLGTTLTADIYVAFDGDGAHVAPDVLAALERIAGVSSVGLTRTLALPTRYGPIAIRGMQPGADGWGLDILDTDPARSLTALANGDGAVISERLAFARGLRTGDTLVVPTVRGDKSLPIVGTFRDFNTGSYSAVVALPVLRREWNDELLSGIAVRLSDSARPRDVETALHTLLGDDGVRIRSSTAIRELSLAIFDRTFKITEVLRALAAIVAFLGVLSALLSIELERTREIAVLRALGFPPRSLMSSLLIQTGLLGATAGAGAIPLGVVLAALLVYVINERSFGWTMRFHLAAGPLLAGMTLAVAAALLAGLYPAVRARRGDLAAALREE
jgi:putative ABC transport system permease protein